ncbi:hypothetical protein [Candidatus Harpocratesius sp.]
MEIGSIDEKFSNISVDPFEYYYHIERLKRILRSLELYQNSKLVYSQETKNEKIIWNEEKEDIYGYTPKDGFSIAWTSHLNATLIDFKELGFNSHREFYKLSQELRDNFLQSQYRKFKATFPSDFEYEAPNTEVLILAHSFYRDLRKEIKNLI